MRPCQMRGRMCGHGHGHGRVCGRVYVCRGGGKGGSMRLPW